MHLHGVILDLYDDPTASVLRSKLAGAELPPELGDSSVLEAEKLASMPDRLFALVAKNGDDVVRKYAMHDAPHVTTSIVYFLEQGHLLPDSMQKIAARNLLAACEWYDLQAPDELVKRAGMLDAAFGVLDVKQRLDNTMASSRSTMDGFRAAQAGASSDMQQREKKADLTGTEMMPMSGSVTTWPLPRNTAKPSSQASGTKRAQWEHAGDLTYFKPTVKAASIATSFCLPSVQKYPIDSYEQVKQAAAYFDEHWAQFSLDERREFAVHLAARQEELGLTSSDHVSKYAGHGYGPHIDVELAARMRNYEGTGHEEGYSVLVEKRASIPPHVMADMLYELDQVSGAAEKYAAPLGFRDPFQAVYGKVAAEAPKPWSWSEGNEYVNDVLLKDLAVNRYQSLDRAFGVDMRKSFQKDPISVFESLPEPQKVVVARLAADDSKA